MLRSLLDGPKRLETSNFRPGVPGSVPRAMGFTDSGAAVEALLEVAAQAAEPEDEPRCEDFSAVLSVPGSSTC